MESWRYSDALVSHVSLQVSSSQIAFAARWTRKTFRVVSIHFRKNLRHTSQILFFSFVICYVIYELLRIRMCVCVCVKVTTKRYERKENKHKEMKIVVELFEDE